MEFPRQNKERRLDWQGLREFVLHMPNTNVKVSSIWVINEKNDKTDFNKLYQQ